MELAETGLGGVGEGVVDVEVREFSVKGVKTVCSAERFQHLQLV